MNIKEKIRNKIGSPINNYSSLPEEVDNYIRTQILKTALYLVILIGIVSVYTSLRLILIGLFLLFVQIIINIHTIYIFIYDKISYVEGTIVKKEKEKTGSFIFLKQENIFFKIRVKSNKKYNVDSVIRVYAMPSCIYKKEDDLSIISAILFSNTIKNSFR